MAVRSGLTHLSPRKEDYVMPTAVSRPGRQDIRRMIGIFLVILFPAIYYYFSPYISMMGAAQGVIAGSLFLFALLFLVPSPSDAPFALGLVRPAPSWT